MTRYEVHKYLDRVNNKVAECYKRTSNVDPMGEISERAALDLILELVEISALSRALASYLANLNNSPPG